VHVVVLQGWDAGDVDELVRVLADALGRNLPEARTRLLGGGPIVVASFPEAGPATALADTLRSRRIGEVSAIGRGELETDAGRFCARGFELGELGLRAVEREHRLEIPYGEIELLLRGTRVETHAARDQPSTREFSLARAVASGGLLISRPVAAGRTRQTEERTGFLQVYAGERPVVALREADLRFQSLGPELRPSRQANFQYLVAELRRRAPAAIYDDRLIQRGGQVQLLGPGLSTDRHLDVALSVLARALRNKA
jgi:hypothetical protein